MLMNGTFGRIAMYPMKTMIPAMMTAMAITVQIMATSQIRGLVPRRCRNIGRLWYLGVAVVEVAGETSGRRFLGMGFSSFMWEDMSFEKCETREGIEHKLGVLSSNWQERFGIFLS